MKEVIALIQNLSLSNLDLLTVGISIAAIALLGFVVYISNAKSITNISFLLFCFVTMLWSFFNYASYQSVDTEVTLFLLRAVIFLGVWHSFSFFHFFFVFPLEKKNLSWWYKYILVPYVALVSVVTLTPLVFSGVGEATVLSNRPEPIAGKLIGLFAITVISLLVASFVIFIKKIIKSEAEKRSSYILILAGAVLTFILLFTFNLVLPAFFETVRFVPLGALTMFPFATFTAYAIFKHRTFKVKNIGSSIFAFLLCVATFVEIIFAENAAVLLLRVGVFLFTLLISIQFIKNIFKLESVSDQKSEFISFASHEIRTPITVMKGYAALMVESGDKEMSKEMRSLAKKILISGNDVISLISQYLNKSKMELGQLQYSFSPVDLKSLVEDLVLMFKINAEERGLALSLESKESEVYIVTADQGKIKEVIGNLIDNSLKYTPKGAVTITLSKGKGVVLVTIADTGVGIEKDLINQLFQEFGRVDTEKINILGTGLGLYLAKTFVEAHNGRVWAESDGVGKGSQFYVELPE